MMMNKLSIIQNLVFFKVLYVDLSKLSLKVTKGLLTAEEAGIFLQEYRSFIHISLSMS